MKKLSTHIKGLDTLFHGGLQVTSVTDPDRSTQTSLDKSIELYGPAYPESWSVEENEYDRNNNSSVKKENNPGEKNSNNQFRDSLVIVIRGCRGCHKHLFAMQLMHGLGVSVYDYLKKEKETSAIMDSSSKTSFQKYDFKGLSYYSINKQEHLLEDMYLDLLIERWISHTNIEYKEILLEKETNKVKEDKIFNLNERNLNICRALFEWDNLNRRYSAHKYSINKNFTYYIANNIIGYNARTNSLHWRSGSGPDDNSNLLVRRKAIDFATFFDKIKFVGDTTKKMDDITESSIETNKGQNNREYYEFESEFLKVSFKLKGVHTAVRNAITARSNFFNILHEIEDMAETEEENVEENEYPREVLVIEGFSHLSERDLQTLPYTHLLNCLRRVARISILVFENSQTTMPDGDIEIEIKSNFDKEEEYTYNELRISKSVNQVAASGWHLYKRQESHIRIYPSLHLRLFKRSYINNQMHEIGRPVFEDSYDRYWDVPAQVEIERETHMTPYEIMSRSSLSSPIADKLLFQKAENYKNFSLSSVASTNGGLYGSMLEKYLVSRIQASNEPFEEWAYYAFNRIISSKWYEDRNYFPKKSEENGSSDQSEFLIRLHSHPPVTTIVGNPNSYKRSLALCQAFNHKKLNEDGHVLVVLLDKDSDEMRKKILCPGLYCKVSKDHKALGECIECYKKITFLNVNPGCITPEELLSMIQDHIRVYVGKYDKFDKKRPLHIIFDDYHRIDFNFPFLSSSTLFTSALISLCQSYEVGLTILCDKNSRRVREVCTLSDYVLCVERHEKDVNRISIYMERMGDLPNPTSFLKYDISKLPLAMECGDKGLMVSKDFYKESITVSQIGSMKEYWRKTVNTVDTERPRHDNRKSYIKSKNFP